MTGVWLKRVRAWSMVGLTVPTVLFVASSPSHAEASFASVAEAQVFHVTVTNDKGAIPTLPQIDAGIGTTKATFSSYGGGVARAASPDAGSAASVPALLGALVPTLIPQPLPFELPSVVIPGDITVQTGQKPAKVGTGPYALAASVSDAVAESKATLGGALDDDNGILKTVSSSKITVGEDDSVTAKASTTVDGVTINGLVSIGKVTSSAEVVRDADGTLHRSASTSIGLIELAGLKLSFEDDAFVTPLGKLPLSITQVSNLLLKLTGGNFELRFQKARNTENGIVSGSLQIVQKVPPPPQCIAIPLPTPIVSGVTYCGTTTVVYDFGKAAASTDYALVDDTPGGGGDPAVTPPITDAGLGSDPVAAGGIGEVPLLPLDPGSIDTGAGVPTLTPGETPPVSLLEVRARFVDVSNLYLAVAGFALLLLLSSTCIRLLGVRNKWTS